MTLLGRVRNGVVVLDQPLQVPEGTVVQVDVPTADQNASRRLYPRQGGQWKGQVHIAPDFDVLPDDLREALGMKDS
jgi:hypothetical protein